MGIKERRTKVILALFIFSDVNSNYIKISDETFLNTFDLALNRKTKDVFKKLVAEELVVHGNEDEYRITDKGLQALYLEFPYFRFLRDSWDQKWRILSYEIPESKRELRDRLRREVVGWGLGPWHRSFWITPHPIISELENLVKGREEEKYIQAFQADHVFGDRDFLIEKVWNKSGLDKKYRELFKSWHSILSKEEEKSIKLGKIIKGYLDVIRQDPGLPKELVGEAWIGFEAYNIYREIRGILLT